VICRRAFELELAEFLADPRAPGFAGFREHYPRCPDCAAEVRAWTELVGLLGGENAHPAPERLLRFAETPAALAPETRSAVERHLRRCAACRDELAGLARFDPAALAAPPTHQRVGAGRLLATLGRIAWHPATAYALLLLVTVPALQALRGEAPPEAMDAMATSQPGALAEESASTERAAAPAPLAATSRAMLSDAASDVVAVRVPVGHARDEVEIRLVSPDGRRELRERVAAAGGEVELHVPAAWLTPGRWRVERGEGKAATALVLDVPAPGEARQMLRARPAQ
jgi:hypothetical protein